MTLREFSGEEHYKFARQEFDNARQYLKNCGKPKDNVDIFMIGFHRQTCEVFKKYLTS